MADGALREDQMERHQRTARMFLACRLTCLSIEYVLVDWICERTSIACHCPVIAYPLFSSLVL